MRHDIELAQPCAAAHDFLDAGKARLLVFASQYEKINGSILQPLADLLSSEHFARWWRGARDNRKLSQPVEIGRLEPVFLRRR